MWARNVFHTSGIQPFISLVSPPQGASGELVLLTGSGFSPATTVTIGGASASVSNITEGSALVVVPTLGSEGAKDVVLETPTGRVVAASAFTYYNTYAPQTTSFTTVGSATYTVPAWCNFVDVIVLGGGQGGGAGTVGLTGSGGNAGSWNSALLSRGTSNLPWETTSISVTVGAGGIKGAQFTYDTPGGAGGASSISTGTFSLSGSGGPASNRGNVIGANAGNTTVNTVTYTGGDGGGQGSAGSPPGGGGGGGAIFNGVGGDGGRGQVWFRAHQ